MTRKCVKGLVSTAAGRTVMYTENLSQSLRIRRKHCQIPGKEGGEDTLSLVFIENFDKCVTRNKPGFQCV